jgi:hypothetical protein
VARDPKLLSDREKSLEEQFFSRQSAELKERLRQKHQAEATAAELAAVSGIEEGELLRRLVELGIRAESWVALSLVPLVEVAWANGQVEAKERHAVLSAAEANGIPAASPAHQMLESWLTHRPAPGLLQAWGEYTVALCATLDPAQRRSLREQILGRARHVAEAAGGFLGLGSKVSREEEVVLEALAKAFDRSPS